MSNGQRLAAESIFSVFPRALVEDPHVRALAIAVAEALALHAGELTVLRLYSQIDSMPEDLLDILAQDFKVDWWDPDYTVEEKRATLKDSWRVHRMLGTPAAVVTAISAIYPATQIAEWWEYDGEPYHFRLMIDTTYERADPEKHARVLERVNYYKNLRSVLDDIEYYDGGGQAVEYAMTVLVGEEIEDSARAVKY